MFKKLSAVLNKKLKRKDYLSKQLQIVEVFDFYKKEVGGIFPGEDARPISLKNGVLTVEASGAAAANELRLHEHEIIKKINHHLGKEVVSRVVYRF